VEGKNSRTVILEKWQPSVSSSLTAACGPVQQWAEDIPSHWWESDGVWKTIYKTREKDTAEVL
jgi:hypothetical protein